MATKKKQKPEKKSKAGLIVLIVLLVIFGAIGFGVYKFYSFGKKVVKGNQEFMSDLMGAAEGVKELAQQREGLVDMISSANINSAEGYLNAIRNKSAMDCKIFDPETGTTTLIKTNQGFTQMRSQTDVDGTLINSLMLGETSYTWNEGETTGIQMTITPELMTQATELTESYYGTDDENNAVVLDCLLPTGLNFDLPKNIEFTDYSALFKEFDIDLSSLGL